jgi:hypothetical protein
LAINSLVGMSMTQTADAALLWILEEHAVILSDERLRELAHASAGHTDQLGFDFTGERYAVLDTIQRLYTDDGRGDGAITFDGLRVLAKFDHDKMPKERTMLASLPAAYFAIGSRREVIDHAKRVFALLEQDAKMPLWKIQASGTVAGKLDKATASSMVHRTRYLPLTLMAMSHGAAFKTAEIARAWHDAAQLALALEAYRRKRGNYPASLAELAPAYLPAAPIDRSSGEPLRYRLVEGRPVIYGLGYDRVDHGGLDGPTWFVQGGGPPGDAADWVLYPFRTEQAGKREEPPGPSFGTVFPQTVPASH